MGNVWSVTPEANELTVAVDEGNWRRVDQLLQDGVEGAELRWTVKEGIKRAADVDVMYYVIPHCPDDLLDLVLTTAASRRCWGSAARVLRRGMPDSARAWALGEASRYANPSSLQNHMLDFCKDEERDAVLREIVSRGFWRIASKLLHGGVSEATRAWVLEEATALASDNDLLTHMLPHFNSDQEKESLLTKSVERGLWATAGRVLHCEPNRGRVRWFVEEASRKMNFDADLIEHVLPSCQEDQLEFVMEEAVNRGKWRTVGILLTRPSGITDGTRRTAVTEASSRASETDLMENNILLHCVDDEQLKKVLQKVQERDMWHAIAQLVKQRMHPTGDRPTYYGKTQVECSPEMQPKEYVLLHCHDDDLEFVFETAMQQRMWRVVAGLMRRPVDQSLKEEAVNKFMNKAERFDITDQAAIFIPNCTSALQTLMLTGALEQEYWEVVGVLLEKKNIGQNKKKRAIREACNYGTDFDVQTYILPNCSGQLLEFATKEMKKRKPYDLQRFARLIWRYYFPGFRLPFM